MKTSTSVKVGDIASQIRGVTYAKEEAEDVPTADSLPILRANNITDNGLTFDSLIYIPRRRISEDQILRSGDVLVAASSGSLDVVGKAAPLNSRFCGSFGAFCKVLRPSKRVNPSYFSHFFRTPAYRRRISSLAAGANINNLRNEHLDDLEIPLPPMEEQRRIAAILDKADALRQKRRLSLQKLDSLTHSLFLDMFGDPAANLKGWPRTLLGAFIESGPQNGLYKPAESYGDGTPILRIDAFYDGEVTDYSKLKRLRLTPEEIVLYRLKVNDIVVNRVNSMEYLGKSALIAGLSEDTVFESNMMRFSIDRKEIEPQYLIAFLQTSYIKAQILQRSKNAVNQSSINQEDVKSFTILQPPLALQKSFAERAAKAKQHIKTQMQAKFQHDALFKSLQSRAFQGEL
jgi:type I restriction enzyme S subunit